MAVVNKRTNIRDYPAFSVRLPPEIKKMLEDLAYARRTSMGQVVQALIEAEVVASQGEIEQGAE